MNGLSIDEFWKYETEAWEAGYPLVCGCDEAGAGPLAGPVYAAAVILPVRTVPEGLDDSKKLTEKQRDRLYDEIRRMAFAYGVASVSAAEIDAMDILSARMLAMQRAIEAMARKPDFVLIDGNRDHGRHAAILTPHRCVVKGDSLSASIAAASVLAKVSRDRHMTALDKQYPGYGFAKHKGYPTKAHYEALESLGPCPQHRKTFRLSHRPREHGGIGT